MKKIFLFLVPIFFMLIGSLSFLTHTTTVEPTTSHKKIFMGVFIDQHDRIIPFFLRSIERLDYPKKAIHLQLNVNNDSEEIRQLIAEWIATHKTDYQSVVCVDSTEQFKGKTTLVERNREIAQIKDSFLKSSKRCDYCFITSSEVLLEPYTITYLLEKKKPVIAPMLRPQPTPGDPFRNFFGDVTENGYYKHHSDYELIANRKKIGTFKVPCVHAACLIEKSQLDRLSFTKHFRDWDFVAFSNSARENNIEQYVTNEREFGFLLHLKGEPTIDELKKFEYVHSEAEVTPGLLNTLLSDYFSENPSLITFQSQFNFDNYTLFRIENQDLYYVDDVHDYIKEYVLKQGWRWEEQIHERFKKYVKPGSVALDIGAHIGTHTLNLSRLVGPEGLVHAFEPQVKMFTELAINMHLNKCENVVLHPCALGHEEKWITMWTPPEEWTKRFGPDLVNEGHGTVKELLGDESERAQMKKLDSLELNNLSFIKMDVEGFEMEVIAGGIETIKRNKPVMIVEIFQGPERQNKIQTVDDLGYVHTSLGGDDLLFIPLELFEKGEQIPHQDRDKPIHKNGVIKVVWEGSFLDFGSLSHVNRHLTDALEKINGIDLSRKVNASTYPTKHSELEEYSSKSNGSSHQTPQVTVRHAWPPLWVRPITGKWVLIQPWEFGSLPAEWITKIEEVDEVWVPSSFVKTEYVDSGVPEAKVVVVPNGIDPTIFHPQAPNYPLQTDKKFKFLFVGGTIYRKGPDVLLKAYQNAFSKNDDVCLVIKDFGTKGGYAAQTHQNEIKKAQQLESGPEIIYLDQELSSEEVAGLYTACDCLVYPYRGEGFALPVLEAMACGLPVIVTDGGATDDFVFSEFGWRIPSHKFSIGSKVGGHPLIQEGWFLEPDSDALSGLLQWVVKHPEQAKAKGAKGSDYAHRYWTWDHAAEIASQRLLQLVESEDKR